MKTTSSAGTRGRDDKDPSKQSRRVFLKIGAGALGGLALGESSLGNIVADASSGERKPNFVFFLGEGLRWDEFSCMGNRILRTPNMDRLAREGMVFKNAFVTNALCLPSRASILTGLYSHTTGAIDNRDRPIPSNFPLVSEILSQAGYEVAFFGKSHVRGGLQDRYWDYYFGFNGQCKDYYHPILTEGIGGKYSEPKTYNGYVDDIVTNKALEWMAQKRDKPFCLFLWFWAPHAPFYRDRKDELLYNGVKIPVPSTFNDDLKGYPGKPAFADANDKIGSTMVGTDDARSLEELVKDHYAGVVNNDDHVGQVFKALREQGQLDDTAMLLSSDHGFFLGEWHLYDKRFMHEPSIRVPLMVRYPRMVRAGSVCEEMALNVDFMPTMLELAGLSVPAGLHGQSLVPFLGGRRPENWRKDWLYEYFEYPEVEHVRPHRGVRTERYKLIHYHKLPQFPDLPEEFELYDLHRDPGELHDLYGQDGYESLTQHLLDRIFELRKETDDQTTDETT
ncbi:MAG TPA: sulfatase [Verrucomicrobiae bacterium]|nr:sulfatase [Verrucomicrobiae bacterium]